MDLKVGRRLGSAEIEALLDEARARTEWLTEPVSEEDLGIQHDSLMSPIVWDLGHIAHFEEVWLVENLRGGITDREGLRGIYNPFENPRATRGGLALPSVPECMAYMRDVRRAALATVTSLDIDSQSPLTGESFVFRMVLQHEYQHNETILQTLQLKRGEPYAAPRRFEPPAPDAAAPEAGAMVRFPGGRVEMGTDDRSVAYDNERPLHLVEIEPFWIDVHPVTNGEYLAFVEDGGYRRPDVWSGPGWSWREEARLEAPEYWKRTGGGWSERFMNRVVVLEERRPVCHLCYWEADAYARWAGKRLPTEQEWEAAASWDPEAGQKHTYPWGEESPSQARANLDAVLFETTEVGSYPCGVSAIGCWDMLGNVWEWTSSDFRGYPGYETFPYPEYSEVFFGDEYKVLRGGSWATRFGAIRNTFRNWDYPIRRQIFSGIRCVRDE